MEREVNDPGSKEVRPRVLVVDDDPDHLRPLSHLLANDGYDVEVASSGSEAFRKLRKATFDIVLLDVHMPEEDGFTVCSRIQEAFTLPPPILFLTGRDETAARVRGLDAGGQDYIVKPFDPDELKARIRVALRTRWTVEELAARVARDPLTGLLNRGEMPDRLGAAIAAAARFERPLTGLMIDVDRFKAINDALGHLCGDMVLVECAHRLEAAVRASDMLFRYGGEEFFLVVPDVPTEQVLALAERLRACIAEHPCTVRLPGEVMKDVAVTISIGVAPWHAGMDAATFVQRADDALYAAKGSGRDRVVVHG